MRFRERNNKGRWQFKISVGQADKLLNTLEETGQTYRIERAPTFWSLTTSHKTHFTLICEYYPGPQAHKHLLDGKEYNLLDTPCAQFLFNYDKRKSPGQCLLQISEGHLALMEKNIYRCKSEYKHYKKDIMMPPLKDGYAVFCMKCGQPLSMIEESKFSNIRQILLEAERNSYGMGALAELKVEIKT